MHSLVSRAILGSGGAALCLALAVSPTQATLTDIDGNTYATVQIGDQVWMAENLKVTTFRDGVPIAENDGVIGSWCNGTEQYLWADTRDLNDLYDFDLPFDFYGAVYNEEALASGRLAPTGWRIPSIADWTELRDFISADGFPGAEGTALKSTEGWLPFSGVGADAYGFGALPAGYVSSCGNATGAGAIATWASSEPGQDPGRRTVMNVLEATMDFAENSTTLGAPVRALLNLGTTSVPGGTEFRGLRLGRPYPSPSRGPVQLSLSLPAGIDTADLEIVDVTGRRVGGRIVRGTAGGTRTVGLEETADLPAGVYFVRVQAGGSVAVRKLVRLGDAR